MIKNMVTILNRFILICKVCNTGGYVKMEPYVYPYGYHRVWHVITIHADPHSISIFVSIWILQSVECPHTPCRLTVYIEYTANP